LSNCTFQLLTVYYGQQPPKNTLLVGKHFLLMSRAGVSFILYSYKPTVCLQPDVYP
ncbi:hypothetical protein T07_2444, partial [Trichinella nelsoni]